MTETLDRLLEIAEARSYIGEEIFVNAEGKNDVRQHSPTEQAYHYGRQARAWYKPIVDNPHVAMTLEWTYWRDGWRSMKMPTPEALERMKGELDAKIEEARRD